MAAGRPTLKKREVHDCRSECYWCGRETGSAGAYAVKDVCGVNFTDHDVAAVPLSPEICRACAWVMSGRPPDTLRMWSVVWVSGWRGRPAQSSGAPDLGPDVWLGNKADLGPVSEVLVSPPPGEWCVSVADSGKVHTAPLAVINRGRGPWVVRYERYDVASSSSAFTHAREVVVRAYAAGYSRAAVLDQADASPVAIKRMGVGVYEQIEHELTPLRNSPLLHLVTTLTRRPR